MFNSWQFMLNRNRLQLVSYHVSNGELGLKMKSGFDHCMLEHDFAEAPFLSFQRRELTKHQSRRRTSAGNRVLP